MSATTTAIVPLEQLVAAAGPHALAKPGSVALQAAHAADLQAVTAWLALHQTAPHTWRAYRRAAERLLLWCHFERCIPLLNVGVEDAFGYRQWLQGLGHLPAATWAAAGWRLPSGAWLSGQARTPRGGPAWRPFAAAPGKTAQQQDLAILQALFGHLRRHGLVTTHPFERPRAGSAAGTRGRLPAPTTADTATDARPGTPARANQAPRATAMALPPSGAVLSQAEWDCLLCHDGPPGQAADARHARAMVVLWLGHSCGLRAAEMLALKLGDLHAEAAFVAPAGVRGVPRCTWSVSVGEPGTAQRRQLPLPEPAARAVVDYVQCLGLGLATAGGLAPAADTAAEDAVDPAWLAQPLLRAKRGRPGRSLTPWSQPARAMSYSSLQRDVRRHVSQCTAALALLDPAAAARLRGVTAQWLRDGFAAQALRAGQPLPTVAALMGQRTVLAAARRSAPLSVPALADQGVDCQQKKG